MPLLFKRLQESNKNSDKQSWQQTDINNQNFSRINYHPLKSKDMTMANSLYEMRLQGATVVVFITLDWILFE